MTEYTLIRAQRKTMALQVKNDGSVVVRAPLRMTKGRIDVFVQKHEEWIARAQRQIRLRNESRRVITEEERAHGYEEAAVRIPERAVYFARKMGVTYGRITIREQKTRWGSCSAAGNLNFNWKLVLLPPELLDYVVVHELAHRREMNHSPRFWAIVEEQLPDWRERRARLKEQNIG